MNKFISALIHFLLFVRNSPRWAINATAAITFFCMMNIGYLLYSLPADELLMIPEELLNGNPLAFLLMGLLALFASQLLQLKETYNACVKRR